MAKTLKVGVIGVGGIARTHFPGWETSPHTEMVAFSDNVPETLERMGKTHNITKLYSKPEDMFADKDIDIIDVCTPNMYHAPLSCAALLAGKHVICEKPLAPTPADIKNMIAARNKSGKLLMTAQHFRYDGRSKALKAEIASGRLGEIYHARSWMLRRSGAPTRAGFVMKQHSGGGPCIDIGVHILDLTLWMMGFPKPVAISGITQDKLAKQPGAFSNWGAAIPDFWDVEEMAAAFVRFANGGTLVLEVSWLLNHKTTGEDMQMWLYGTEGGSHWPSNELLWTDKARKQHYNTQLVNAEGGMDPHGKECMDFADAIANGKPSPVPPEESLDVLTILDGLYRSSAAGKEIAL